MAMQKRKVTAAAITVAALCAPAFVVVRPGGIIASQTLVDHGLLRSGQEQPFSEDTKSGMTSTVATSAVFAAALLGAGALKKQNRTSMKARRELAVAYEDSGIELLDNGKFCQGLVGGDGAWGEYNFDPAGFSKFTELVPYLREAELKHARICMLAWIGLAAPDFIRIPGERYSFEAIPVTIDAHDKLNGSIGVNFQILFWVAVLEFCCAKKVFEWNSLECAGDYNLGAQFLPTDEEGQRKIRTAELKNGRLAMVAFGGAVTQAVITRHPFPWLF